VGGWRERKCVKLKRFSNNEKNVRPFTRLEIIIIIIIISHIPINFNGITTTTTIIIIKIIPSLVVEGTVSRQLCRKNESSCCFNVLLKSVIE